MSGFASSPSGIKTCLITTWSVDSTSLFTPATIAQKSKALSKSQTLWNQDAFTIQRSTWGKCYHPGFSFAKAAKPIDLRRAFDKQKTASSKKQTSSKLLSRVATSTLHFASFWTRNNGCDWKSADATLSSILTLRKPLNRRKKQTSLQMDFTRVKVNCLFQMTLEVVNLLSSLRQIRHLWIPLKVCFPITTISSLRLALSVLKAMQDQQNKQQIWQGNSSGSK